jgi:hypothetical protein
MFHAVLKTLFNIGINMKKTLFGFIFGLICTTSSSAAVTQLALVNVDPTPWRLQTYTSATYEQIAVWFTTSPCGANQLLLFPSPVASEKNRFWNTVLAAKIAKQRMFITYNYDSVTQICMITSYALEPG